MVKETKDLKNKTRGRPSSLRAVGGTNERTNASRFSVEERRRRRRRGVEGGRREGVGEVGGSSLSKLDMWRTRPLALTLQPSAPLLQTLPGPAGRHTCPWHSPNLEWTRRENRAGKETRDRGERRWTRDEGAWGPRDRRPPPSACRPPLPRGSSPLGKPSGPLGPAVVPGTVAGAPWFRRPHRGWNTAGVRRRWPNLYGRSPSRDDLSGDLSPRDWRDLRSQKTSLPLPLGNREPLTKCQLHPPSAKHESVVRDRTKGVCAEPFDRHHHRRMAAGPRDRRHGSGDLETLLRLGHLLLMKKLASSVRKAIQDVMMAWPADVQYLVDTRERKDVL